MTALVQSSQILSLRELVVAIDHLVRPRGFKGRRPPLVAAEKLQHSVQTSRGRGTKTLKLAFELARVGAESRMETLTRLNLQAYGLAHYFELQVEIFDADGLIGRFDLVDRARKTIVEFDGEQHRTDRAQYEKDLWRLDRARAADYQVIRLLSGDILHRPHQTATRVAAALGVERCPHPLAESLLAPSHSPYS